MDFMGRIVTKRVTQTVETRVSATEWAGNVTEDVSLDGGIPDVTQVRSLLIDWVFGDLRRTSINLFHECFMGM